MNTGLGLIIGSNTVAGLQLQFKKNQFVFKNFSEYSLSENIFEDHKIINWQILNSVLIKLHHGFGKKNREIAIALPAQLINMQKILLPKSILAEHTADEIKKYIDHANNNRDKYALDYRIDAETVAGYQTIFFALTHHDYLAELKNCIELAGFKIKIIDVSIFAILRALKFFLKMALCVAKPDAILCVTGHYIEFLVLDSGSVLFYRHLQYQLHTIEDQLRSLIQTYQLIFPGSGINKFIFCINDEFNPAIKILNVIDHNLILFTKNKLFELYPIENQEFAANLNILELLQLFGLAIRKLSKW